MSSEVKPVELTADELEQVAAGGPIVTVPPAAPMRDAAPICFLPPPPPPLKN